MDTELLEDTETDVLVPPCEAIIVLLDAIQRSQKELSLLGMSHS